MNIIHTLEQEEIARLSAGCHPTLMVEISFCAASLFCYFFDEREDRRREMAERLTVSRDGKPIYDIVLETSFGRLGEEVKKLDLTFESSFFFLLFFRVIVQCYSKIWKIGDLY